MTHAVLWYRDEACAVHVRPPEAPAPESSALLGWSALDDDELRLARELLEYQRSDSTPVASLLSAWPWT